MNAIVSVNYVQLLTEREDQFRKYRVKVMIHICALVLKDYNMFCESDPGQKASTIFFID